MGTYIYFAQPDTSISVATNEILFSKRDADGNVYLGVWDEEDERIECERGRPNLCKMGTGDVKLNNMTDDETQIIADLLQRAVNEIGLVITDMPSNASDYFSDAQIEQFFGLEKYKILKQTSDEEYQNYLVAQKSAYEKKLEELDGGVFLANTWGFGKVWLIFGNVDKCTMYQYTFTANGKEYKDIFRDKSGNSYMLIPLMTFNPDGAQIVYNCFVDAWNNLGLRTDPKSIMACVYGRVPESLNILGLDYDSCKFGYVGKYDTTKFMISVVDGSIQIDKFVTGAFSPTEKIIFCYRENVSYVMNMATLAQVINLNPDNVVL